MRAEHLSSPTDAEALYADRRVRVAAFMTVLAHRGVMFDTDVFEGIINDLADVAQEHDATPEAVQIALVRHEVTLRAGPVESIRGTFDWGEPTFNEELESK